MTAALSSSGTGPGFPVAGDGYRADVKSGAQRASVSSRRSLAATLLWSMTWTGKERRAPSLLTYGVAP